LNFFLLQASLDYLYEELMFLGNLISIGYST